jgi:exopolysaccharide biosynthesis protein
VNSRVDTVASTAGRYHASIAVNGGYFDSRSKQSVSFVVDQGSLASTPRLDPRFAKYLPQILNRSELREVVGEDGQEKFTIASHYAPIPAGAAIEESLQAGPELLPDYSPQREAFKRRLPNGRRIDAIDSTSTANRSALGITSVNKLIIISVANDATSPDASGATLVDLADILESLGAVEALNLDGGSSTTMYVRFADGGKKWHESVVANASRMRLIKSVLLLCPNN